MLPKALKPFGLSLYETDLADLPKCLAEHCLVVLRSKRWDQRAFCTFMKSLGPLMFTSGETPSPDCPDLNIVTNEGRSRPPISHWHTDTSYVSAPPAYTALLPLALPSAGGETCFTNQYLAYDTLGEADRALLSGRRVRHVVTGVKPGADTQKEAWQPLFRKHPVSRRTSLYLSTLDRCLEIEGFSIDESRAIMDKLYAHSRSTPVYKHHWRSGDVLIWDNRCTLHKADHSQVNGRRTFVRAMVAGEVPLMAAA